MSGACDGCTCGRANGNASGNGVANGNATLDDNYIVPNTQAFDREPRSFTDPAEGVYAPLPTSTQSGPAVPLRSKKWFNDMDDPGEFANCLLQDMGLHISRNDLDLLGAVYELGHDLGRAARGQAPSYRYCSDWVGPVPV
jgi:dihydroxy-acid dehydratase